MRASSNRGSVDMADPILILSDVSIAFKGIKALNALSFAVERGEICALIGPNGAGKSSLLNVVSGVYRATAGDVVFDGVRFEAIHPRKAAALGIGRTFQHNALFGRLTARENVLAGLARQTRTGTLEHLFRVGRDGAERRAFAARADRVLDFVGIGEWRDRVVSTLPYGVQKRVDLARALVAEPKLLLLDEPLAGMNHDEKRAMSRLIAEVNRGYGTTVVLIEHDVGIVLGLADHVVVLDYGRKVADGPPERIRTDPEVVAAYLGRPHAAVAA